MKSVSCCNEQRPPAPGSTVVLIDEPQPNRCATKSPAEASACIRLKSSPPARLAPSVTTTRPLTTLPCSLKPGPIARLRWRYEKTKAQQHAYPDRASEPGTAERQSRRGGPHRPQRTPRDDQQE